MKKVKKLNSFYVGLIKKNLVYILALGFFAILLTVVIPLQINAYLDLQVELDTKEIEKKHVEDSLKKIRSYQGINLTESLKTINTVYPKKPDRFTLFHNIASLQDAYPISIQNFSSPFSDKAEEVLGINVRSLGTPEAFVQLLQDYHFKTGKLATIDRIFYDMDTQDLNFTIYFHSKDIPMDQGVLFTRQDSIAAQIAELQRLVALQKPNESQEQPNEQNTTPGFAPKENPFSL